MKIFIKNVPSSTTHRALREFVEQVFSPRWYAPFAVKGNVKSCTVQKITDLDTGDVEYHGLLDIQPYTAAQHAIEKLNKKKLNGRPVEVRKWHVRSPSDRRDLFRKHSLWPFKERRKGERRRPNLVMDAYIPIRVEGLKGFHREHNG